jgi:hypothetical protein
MQNGMGSSKGPVSAGGTSRFPQIPAGGPRRELVTTTHALNAPMRAAKARLGYVERSRTIEARGEVP